MSIMRVRFNITGPGGLPGVHTTYWTGASSTPIAADALDVVGRVRAFWNAFKSHLPTTVTVSITSAVDVLNQATADLENQLPAGTVLSVTGTGTGELPKSTMMLLKLNTSAVLNGRFLRGRQFLGPLSLADNTNGIVTPTSNADMLTASTQYSTGATSSALVVWHRPTELLPASGVVSPVTSFGSNPEFSVLRSRRD